MIRGLPQRLQPCHCDLADTKAMHRILMHHHKANYPDLIMRLKNPQAREFLTQAMAVDPDERLTPTAALQHPFLEARAAVVRTKVEETVPSYTQQVWSILDLMAPLQGQQGVFLASRHQQQCEDTPAVTTLEVPHNSIQAKHGVHRRSSTSGSEDDLYHSTSTTKSNICISSVTTPEGCAVEPSVSRLISADDSAVAVDVSKAKQHLGSTLLKAFIKLKSIKSKTGRQKKRNCTKAADPVAASSDLAAGVDAVAVIVPIGLSISGKCGFKFIVGRSKASSTEGQD